MRPDRRESQWLKSMIENSADGQTIQLPYADRGSRIVLTALKMTIALWGLIPAILLLIGGYGAIMAIFVTRSGADMLTFGSLLMIGAIIPTLTLIVIRHFSRMAINIDKNGIEIPADLFSGTLKPTYVPWNKVKKIVAFESSSDKRERSSSALLRGEQLVFHVRDQKLATIALDRLDLYMCEKLLVCLDVFAGNVEQEGVDEVAKKIKHHLRDESQDKFLALTKGDVLTHTELWEDELKRRFRAAAFMPLEPGMIMRNGSLTVLRPLALGGLSAVYLAQLDNNLLVVLKESVVPEDSKEELKTKAREMFKREANLLMKLKHPAVVSVLDYFVENGRSYLLLDYVSGQDLRQYIKQNGRLREALVVEWAAQIATIVDYLHSQDPPVIHRDLTPDNFVIRPDGTIVVIDFGAANDFIGNATGTFVGKQSYIAPEQFRGKACLQSDIYAFGGTLYYLLTGEEPEALSQSEPGEKVEISSLLNDLVKSCTELEVQSRIPTAGKISESLALMSKERLIQ